MRPVKPLDAPYHAPALSNNASFEAFMRNSKLVPGASIHGRGAKGKGISGWPCASVQLMLDTFVPSTSEAAQYIVNIGAQEGDEHDPAFTLHKDKHYAGLLFEGDHKVFEKLDQHIKAINQSGNILIHHEFVYPETVAQVFETYSVPKQFGFLKVDIDSIDLGVTRRILETGYKPGIVMVSKLRFLLFHHCVCIQYMCACHIHSCCISISISWCRIYYFNAFNLVA
mgnify:FL=1